VTRQRRDPTVPGYDHVEIERRWRTRWEADGLFEVDIERVDQGRKFYNLVEFPYPSAEGLHVGHAYTYCGADTIGRYLRMRGREVFQPMGFDSFGIHTENYALRIGEHPRSVTERTIGNYREQLRRLGAAWDWSREVVTSDPSYYRWTQWVFLQLHRAGLAVRKAAPVVWCPSCLTVLAFEQVEGERCERCGTPVTRRFMRQWFLRTTAYADALVDGLDALDWPEAAKRVQREWIGRSSGVEIDFPVEGSERRLTAFTTRHDTLFGATFLAVAPEHPLALELASGTPEEHSVRALVERLGGQVPGRGPKPQGDEPLGAFIGRFAVNPANGRRLPIHVADHVVAAYGTGVVMGVPAHDERDHRYALAAGLPIVTVIVPSQPQGRGDDAWTGEGRLVDSGPFTVLPSEEGGGAIAAWLEKRGTGRRAVRYRMHDWLISRQRYWGPPIPIVYCERCGEVPVPEEDLPVLLPEIEDFRPPGTGRSPLAGVEAFVTTDCPRCGGPGERETDVSDTFLDSAWYFLRYPSTDVHDAPWDPERTGRMLPVDQYAGGPEHVRRHHLYARFVTRALHDLGHVPFAEPFPRLRLHGLLISEGAKMSKSRGNVVNPDHYISRVGADSLRMYLLFCGPWEEGGDFTDRGMQGILRFTRRLWRLMTEPRRPGPGVEDLRALDRAIARVEADVERLKFNTALSALMELVRWVGEHGSRMTDSEWDRSTRTLLLLVAPFAPHLAEELWARLGAEYSIHRQPWPVHDPAAVVEDRALMVVQVDGRVRDRLTVRKGLSAEEARDIALRSQNVRRHLDGGEPRDVVFVPDRLINPVT
jgi:leucyl-tRNA synthetase